MLKDISSRMMGCISAQWPTTWATAQCGGGEGLRWVQAMARWLGVGWMEEAGLYLESQQASALWVSSMHIALPRSARKPWEKHAKYEESNCLPIYSSLCVQGPWGPLDRPILFADRSPVLPPGVSYTCQAAESLTSLSTSSPQTLGACGIHHHAVLGLFALALGCLLVGIWGLVCCCCGAPVAPAWYLRATAAAWSWVAEGLRRLV